MQCDSPSEILDAYLDGELSHESSWAMQEHLKTCSRCSLQIAERAILQRILHGAREHFTPRVEFRKHMHEQLSRSGRRSRALPWLSLALTVTASILIAILWIGERTTYDTVAELADLHINALASVSPVDVVSTDRHTVKPWFQGKIPFAFNLPELSGTDFTLVGGRLVYLRQQPGAQLIVSFRQHKISVLIFQEMAKTNEFPSSTALDRRTSFYVQTWQSQGLRFVLVSDAEPLEILRLSNLLNQANR